MLENRYGRRDERPIGLRLRHLSFHPFSSRCFFFQWWWTFYFVNNNNKKWRNRSDVVPFQNKNTKNVSSLATFLFFISTWSVDGRRLKKYTPYRVGSIRLACLTATTTTTCETLVSSVIVVILLLGVFSADWKSRRPRSSRRRQRRLLYHRRRKRAPTVGQRSHRIISNDTPTSWATNFL